MKNGNGNEEINNLEESIKIIEKLNQQIEELKKNIALVREDAQVEIMRRDQSISRLEKINKEHQDLNGRLQLEITRSKGGL
jgi:CHASE3 domain sensor protein